MTTISLQQAAAAKAEVATSRAEAQRVLDSAHSEADSILQRAHRQAEEDAEQLRSTAKIEKFNVDGSKVEAKPAAPVAPTTPSGAPAPALPNPPK